MDFRAEDALLIKRLQQTECATDQIKTPSYKRFHSVVLFTDSLRIVQYSLNRIFAYNNNDFGIYSHPSVNI